MRHSILPSKFAMRQKKGRLAGQNQIAVITKYLGLFSLMNAYFSLKISLKQTN
jgi:hypothetical protein